MMMMMMMMMTMMMKMMVMMMFVMVFVIEIMTLVMIGILMNDNEHGYDKMITNRLKCFDAIFLTYIFSKFQ